MKRGAPLQRSVRAGSVLAMVTIGTAETAVLPRCEGAVEAACARDSGAARTYRKVHMHSVNHAQGAPLVSLHSTVQASLAGRRNPGRDAAARVLTRSVAIPIRISISSMRLLETGLALTAIATALLIGHR
jgi:hypothetical protein